MRLGCVVNLRPHLSSETVYYAFLYAIRQLADEASGAVPRREIEPLNGARLAPETLKRWLIQWVRTRHRTASERTLLSGLALDVPAMFCVGQVLSTDSSLS